MEKRQERILLVDDEQRIRSLLGMYLEKEHYEIDHAEDGKDALRKALAYDYKLIVLDVMLPGMNGIEVCQSIRRQKQTPIVMVTARSDEYGKLAGFEAGADDYVTKPFSPREVVLRIRALLNRSAIYDREELPRTPGRIVLPYLTIEAGAHRVLVMGTEIRLTLKEYDLLYFLARHHGIAFTREELLREVWRYDADKKGDHRTVDTHVKRIREKLAAVSEEASKMIFTIWGLGYSLRNPFEAVARVAGEKS
ncbi:two-component system response regulator ResD [Paenibacillus phyllosphaerae]|uniref:Two-component system response regulator ResD n=1 Tax=Paenibacillus phyllosphaerae TaxID=274593 RepID=A0A7W5B1M7_9BACL|nr:response regulator transcription factor [Paenibacillus phyllosphaerae]MBB3112804.1 two-component system response regulator ResD [Paenibacillus phyllosphaerae]